MKIQCDVCEKAAATVICCADEAALCEKCDMEVHAANKLASKHQRLLLQNCINNKLPPCDICQEKAAFIFCVEDRALFCRDCDEPIHSAGSLAANHRRFLATGIRVALSSTSRKEAEENLEPPQPPPLVPPTLAPTKNNVQQEVSVRAPTVQVSGYTSPTWAVDDLLRISDFETSDKKEEQLEFGDLEWFTDYGLFGEQAEQEALTAAEVPQLRASHSCNTTSLRQTKFYIPHTKKPRIEISDDDNDDEHFTVPDLG